MATFHQKLVHNAGTTPLSCPAITEQLLQHPASKQPYERATQAPFLRLAGQGRLPREVLSQWLSQDRLYAQAYVRFIGSLISRVHLPLAVHPPSTPSLEWRIISILQTALGAIMAELQFFEQTAQEYGLNITPTSKRVEREPATATKVYVELFDSFAADPKKSLAEGLVLLWATEKVYLDSWTYALGFLTGVDSGDDLDGGALREKFIPNWTSDTFRKFVADIENCVDEYVDAQENKEEVEVAVMLIFLAVLELEEGFWPTILAE